MSNNNEIIVNRLDDENGGMRFYQGVAKDGTVLFTFPSVTTILDAAVPKDSYLVRWIREQGIGGQAIFETAADEGEASHISIETLLNGGTVPSEGMTPKVKKCVQAFIDWYNEFKPKIISTEQMVYNMDERYAGGCDFVCELDYEKKNAKGEVKESYKGTFIIDWKTSNSIHDKHFYQVAAYQRAINPKARTAIVHLGNRTKAGWSFKEFDTDKAWEYFQHYNKTFQMNYPDAQPNLKEYPAIFTLPKA